MTNSEKHGSNTVDDPYQQLNELISKMIARNGNRRIGCVGLKKGDTETTVAFGRGPEWSKKVRDLYQTWYATEIINSQIPAEFEKHTRVYEQLEALIDSLTRVQIMELLKQLENKLCRDYGMSDQLARQTRELHSSVKLLGETKNVSALPSSVEADNSLTNASPESGSTESNVT